MSWRFTRSYFCSEPLSTLRYWCYVLPADASRNGVTASVNLRVWRVLTASEQITVTLRLRGCVLGDQAVPRLKRTDRLQWANWESAGAASCVSERLSQRVYLICRPLVILASEIRHIHYCISLSRGGVTDDAFAI